MTRYRTTDVPTVPAELFAEAVAEAERWKDLAQQWHDGIEEQGRELQRVTAERDRYREALTDIKDASPWLTDCSQVARDALHADGPGDGA